MHTLIVLIEQTLGAPALLAMGPIASSNEVVLGAAQSYVNLRWLRSPLNITKRARERCRNKSGASELKSHCTYLKVGKHYM